MHGLTFNGIKKDYLVILRGRKVPVWTEMEHSMITVPGMVGAHYSGTNARPKKIELPVLIESKNFDELEEMKEDLAEWLITDEPKELILDNTPNRTYYAMVDGQIDIENLIRVGRGTITFICPDPYKYGPEQTFEFPSDNVNVVNRGTAEAEPIFELTAKEKVTYAMISREGEDYNLIGTPADDEVEEVDYETSVLYENGSTIDTWLSTQNPDMVNNDRNIHDMEGTMGTDDAGIRANNYGPNTSSGQRAAVVYKELSTAIQDFEVESTFDILSHRERENFRMMLYFNDENMNPLGQIGLKDNSRHYKRRRPIAMVGEHNEIGIMGDSGHTIDDARDTTLFYFRMKREGSRFTFYVGEWMNHRHITTWQETYNDISNDFSGRLKYITLAISSYKDRPTPSRIRMNSVEVKELTTLTEDQTPYVLRPGDVLRLDHRDNDILVNGEPRKDLKNFGGTFFKLKKGNNTLMVSPEEAFDTTITFRDRYK